MLASLLFKKWHVAQLMNFIRGPQARVRTPRLNVEVAMMRRDHCQKPGWDKIFITSNYNIRKTPERSGSHSGSRVCLRRDETGHPLPCPAVDRGHGRRIVLISELLQLALASI